ncbi:MAG TPA: hypothetical protein VEB21_05460 [Terriglobales bacterium]|nr:hypothetical protein [Terriglobales bacterium]
MRYPRRSTLLDLVCDVQRHFESDDEVVRVITELINDGQVVLCGTFAGRRIKENRG